jgi:cellulose synthase/poly-beta-1,6-N-acetylglucosamine synthase-like glycosyltransferase
MALIVLGITLLLTLFYVALIAAYYMVWLRIPQFKSQSQQSVHTSFSVLVPARNESATIETCLLGIINQSYPTSAYEIIVINDDSTDDTAERVQRIIDAHPNHTIRLLHTALHHVSGKKAAITLAAETAIGTYLILTDADCTREQKWLHTINSFVLAKQPTMVYAPVIFKAKSVFEKLQLLEFAGLVAIGGAAIEMNNPNMCSASNLIVSKNAFFAVNGYKGSEHLATGDDEYLLHKVCKQFPETVRFLKNREALVSTSANNTIGELAQQRKRWVSASTTYENRWITAILVCAYLFNALIVYQLFANPTTGLIILGIKALVEGLFIYNVLSFLGQKSTILLLPLAEPFHILYVLFIGLWGNMGTYKWKDRTVN